MPDIELEAIAQIQAALAQATKDIKAGKATQWATPDHFRGQVAWDEMRRVVREHHELQELLSQSAESESANAR